MALWVPTNEDLVTQAKGSVVRRGSTPDHVLLALADSPAHAADLLGTRISDTSAGSPGQVGAFAPAVLVRLVSEPTLGDTVYLSAAVAGSGTNSAPPLAVPLGYVYEKFQESGVWYARLLPENDILLPSDPANPTLPYVEVSSTYAVKPSDCFVNCTSGTFPVTLPPAAGTAGRPYYVKNSGSGTVTVLASGAELIDGETQQSVPPASCLMVVSTGSGWRIS